MTLEKCVVVQRLAGGHFSVEFSACTALLFVLPIIFSKLTGFNPEKMI